MTDTMAKKREAVIVIEVEVDQIEAIDQSLGKCLKILETRVKTHLLKYMLLSYIQELQKMI